MRWGESREDEYELHDCGLEAGLLSSKLSSQPRGNDDGSVRLLHRLQVSRRIEGGGRDVIVFRPGSSSAVLVGRAGLMKHHAWPIS